MPMNSIGAGFCSGGPVAWQVDCAPARQGVIASHDVFVFSHDEFKWLPTDRGHDCILVRPPDSFLAPAGDNASARPRLRCAEFADDSTTHQILRLVRDEVLSGQQMGSMYQEGLIDLLSLRMVRNYVTKPRVVCERVMRLNRAKQKRVLEYMRAALAEDVRIADLADLVPMSPFYFVRAFKAAFGKAPHQFLTQLRMKEAFTLLRTSKSSMTEVAASVGYNSTTHFATQFRRAWGFHPSEARAARAPQEDQDVA